MIEIIDKEVTRGKRAEWIGVLYEDGILSTQEEVFIPYEDELPWEEGGD